MNQSELKFIAAELFRLMKDEGLTFSGGSVPLAQPSTRQQRIDLEYDQDVAKAVARMERKAQATKSSARGQQ